MLNYADMVVLSSMGLDNQKLNTLIFSVALSHGTCKQSHVLELTEIS